MVREYEMRLRMRASSQVAGPLPSSFPLDHHYAGSDLSVELPRHRDEPHPLRLGRRFRETERLWIGDLLAPRVEGRCERSCVCVRLYLQ